ncbi:unnamed protein product [uncultured bacterium]|nr:unnamed protein product [uncultured bacterium]
MAFGLLGGTIREEDNPGPARTSTMTASPSLLLKHLYRLTATVSDLTPDATLLGRFVRDRDEAAFVALVARHGTMVLRLCRRVLGDLHAAEDAFQAAFLVLARRAASIRRRDALAAWLHGVAYRVALKARAARTRRRLHETTTSDLAPPDRHADPLAELTARELLTVLDEEVRRLPEVYRLPVILCCLEGQTQEEAARQLDWTPGSLQGRLERGRALLRTRLTRRGLSLPAALLGTALGGGAAAAAPAWLVVSTVRAALAFALRGVAVAEGAPARVVALAEGALTGMTTTALKVVVALTLTVGLAAGVGLLAHQTPPAGRARLLPSRTPPAQAEGTGKPREGGQARDERVGDPLPAGALARMGSVRFWSGSTVQSVAFAPDGKTLASGNADGAVRLWEANTGKEKAVLKGYSNAVMAVAFSPDGKWLATRGGGPVFQDNSIRLWEVSTGKEVRCFGGFKGGFLPSHNGSTAWAFRVVFSPDGAVLASGAGDIADREHLLRLWDVGTGKELRRCQGHQQPVRCFAFAPAGKTLASGSGDQTVRLWDVATGKERQQLRGHQGMVNALAYSLDGKALASGGEDRVLCLWDAASGKELQRLKVAGPVKSVVFAEDQTLAWGDDQGAIHLVDLKTGREVRRLERHLYGVSDLCRSPDGKVLASVGNGLDFAVHLWDLGTGQQLSPPPGTHRAQVGSVTFTPDGQQLVSAGWDQTMRFWEPATGKELRRVEGGLGMAGCLAYSPDGKILAGVADGGFTVRLWEAASHKELRQLPHPGSGSFQALAFAPDGKTLLTGESRLFGTNFEGVLCLWDVATGKELRVFRGHRARVECVAFSPDGKMVASGSEREPAVRLWETATGKELRQLDGHQIYVQAVTFSHDGALLISVGMEGIRLWEVATGKELRQFAGLQRVSSLVLSPDGRTLAFGGYDNGYVVGLGEVETGKELRRWEGHRNLICTVAFAPDGRTLASGSHDAQVLVWDVTGLREKGRPTQLPLARKELEGLWADLAGTDAPRAHRAVWMLATAPGQGVPLLEDCLRPVPAADPRRLVRLIADLDSEQFKTREDATSALERLGEAAEASLRTTLAKQPSPEVRQRVEQLLQKVEAAAQSPERLRTLRGLQVLEHSGTPEAKKVLQALAKGAPEARVTREAKATLERLARRPTP